MDGPFTVVASTLPANMTPYPLAETTAVTVSLPDSKRRGYVAVAVNRRVYMLEVVQEDRNRAYVNLEREWLPGGTRIVGFTIHNNTDGLREYHVTVQDTVSGFRATSHPHRAKTDAIPLVADTNLLLRYVVGEVERDALDPPAVAQDQGEETQLQYLQRQAKRWEDAATLHFDELQYLRRISQDLVNGQFVNGQFLDAAGATMSQHVAVLGEYFRKGPERGPDALAVLAAHAAQAE